MPWLNLVAVIQSLSLSVFQLGGGPAPAQPAGLMGGLGDLFSLSGGVGIAGGTYSAPKQVSYHRQQSVLSSHLGQSLGANKLTHNNL